MRRALFLLPLLLAASCATVNRSTGTVSTWGHVDGRPVQLYTLTNALGWRMTVTEYGATIVSLEVPDRDGVLADVVLGYDDLEGYPGGRSYFGCIAGRCANRIAGAGFDLDGAHHTLTANDGANSLHGGEHGFDEQVWTGSLLAGTDPAVTFTLRSPDGDEGYPGELDARVTYVLGNDGSLRTEITGVAHLGPTLCNLVQHSYWNLAGHDAGPVLDHVMQSPAAVWLPVDAGLIPTGEVASVAGTPFDFREPKPIGRDLAAVGGSPVGYDHCLVLAEPGRRSSDGLRLVASVHDPRSGRRMELWSNQPGVQFYSGNFLDGTEVGKGGAAYEQYGGFCLETQLLPDAVHHPEWASPVLRKRQTYRHVMVTRFDAE